MQKFLVYGMSCASCSQRVEKAVKKVNGVTKCEVNLLTNSMLVDGEYSVQEVINSVKKAGYGAVLADKSNEKANKNTTTETAKLLKRLIVSVALLTPLLYIMCHMLFGFPIPKFMIEQPVYLGVFELIISLLIIIVNRKFFINGTKSLIHLSPNMDTLISLGSGIAFIYSSVILGVMIFNPTNAGENLSKLYFESSATILTLITVGKTLESYSKGKSTNAIKSLTELAPDTAVIFQNGIETVVPVSEIKVGDVFIIRAGDKIPVDGIITEGSCSINESILTGESLPVDKTVGNEVSSATISLSGYIKCKAIRIGEDTTLSKIIKTVTDASQTKAPAQRVADKVSGVFVPLVLLIAITVSIIWFIISKDFAFSMERGITVLVISCPCSLGLATPVAIMVGNGVGAKNGILFKNATAMELSGKVKTVIFDKTGTLTNGVPTVTDIINLENTQEKLIKIAYSLEYKSEHPLAKAVVLYGKNNNSILLETTNFETVTGLGVKGTINNETYYGGNLKYISNILSVPNDYLYQAEKLANEGKTPLFFGSEKEFLGIIAVADTIREDAIQTVSNLKKLGIKTVMLTGDNTKTANSIGSILKIDEIIAEVLPTKKAEVVENYKKFGKVIMVGDGINDAPALTVANVGFAVKVGTDVAIESAQVVLMKNDLKSVETAIKLGKKTLLNIYENLFWAFIYNLICIPLACGAFSFIGLTMSPTYGALAMSLSSVSVVLNSLRLNLFKNSQEKSTKTKKEHKKKMIKTVFIEGMMCSRCEMHVKKALESINGVSVLEISHEKGYAKISIQGNVLDNQIISVIEKEDYSVTLIK